MSTDATLGYFRHWRTNPPYVGTNNKNMRFRLGNLICLLLFIIKTRFYPSISFIYDPILFSSDSSLVVQEATLVLNFSFADLTFVSTEIVTDFDCHYLFLNFSIVSALTAGLSLLFQGYIYVGK